MKKKIVFLMTIFMILGMVIVYAQCAGINATTISCQNSIAWQTQQALMINDQVAIDQAQSKLKNDQDSYREAQAAAIITTDQNNLTALQIATNAEASATINTATP